MAKRANIVEIFGKDSSQADYLPVAFGTNHTVAKEDVDSIANTNYKFGLESLEGDLQLRDLNTIFLYITTHLKHLFDQGVAEYSPYQDYVKGSLVHYQNTVWIAKKDIQASRHKEMPKTQGCGMTDPCALPLCETPEYPSVTTGWCELVNACDLKEIVKGIDEKATELGEAINNLKGIESFTFNDQERKYEIELSTGNTLEAPNNAVLAEDLDLTKGLSYNTATRKLSVDLETLIDRDFLTKDMRTGKLTMNPVRFNELKDHFARLTELAKENANNQIDLLERELNNTKQGLQNSQSDLNTLKENLSNKGNPIKTGGTTLSGLKGDGTADSPLTVNYNTKDFMLNGSGELTLKPKLPTQILNLDTAYQDLGFNVFYGIVNKAGGNYVVGVPKDIDSEEQTQAKTTVISQVKEGANYDFNGWQFATEYEIQQFISNNGVTWERSNDKGMNPNGTVKDVSSWSDWKRATNSNIPAIQVGNALGQIRTITSDLNSSKEKVQSLETELQALKNKLDEPWTVTSKTVTGNYTVVNTDSYILANGGTITFDGNILQAGRVFTVVQTGSGQVTIGFSNQTAAVAPRNGGFKLAGANAAITVYVEANKAFRAFGDTIA